jgi:predicted anti-sigma-YlaC factor YlaD
MKHRDDRMAVGLLSILILFSSCSINRMATKAVANALTGDGSGAVFTGDTDPELIGSALPFAIKMYEALLSQQPDHPGLILTTGSLFVMYANAFIQGPAEMLPVEAYQEREDQLNRARKLYLRGVDILAGGLEKKYPGWNTAYTRGVQPAYLVKLKKADVPLIYWHAAGFLSAYALNPFDLDLGMRLPELTAAIDRAYELDPDFNQGALDEFYMLFYSSMPEGMGGDPSKVEAHYHLALEKTRGLSPGPYVSYAQAVCIPAQDYDTFKRCLESALGVDIEQDLPNRLVNILSQRKARRLLESAPDFFASLDTDSWDE